MDNSIFNNSTNVLNIQRRIEPKDINLDELDDMAFRNLPRLNKYDNKKQRINPENWSWGYDPGFTYEECQDIVKLMLDWGNDRYIIDLYLELYRMDKGIDLAQNIDEFEDVECITEGMIVRGGVTLLVAESTAGKTTMSIFLADAIMRGIPFFGLKCEKGDILFIEQDEGSNLLKDQWQKIGLTTHIKVSTVKLSWDNDKRKFNSELDDLLLYYRPDLVIIDAFSGLGVKDITRPESGDVLNSLREKATKYNCAFLVLHHLNRSGEPMGSNLHIAKADFIFELKKEGDDTVILSQTKNRGKHLDPKKIDFDRKI
jgi:hypothetical protein